MERYWVGFMDGGNSEVRESAHNEGRARSHEGFLEEFPDYHLDREGEGAFWGVVRNENAPLEEQWACDDPIFWVGFDDELPQIPFVVDSAALAALAWEETRVPDTEVSLNPDGPQKVNLAMWVWLDAVDFEPVSVRAQLDDYGVWAETTATPVRLTLEAGTEDVALHPSGGVCEIRDGRIGEEYVRGRAGEAPPCGVTYLRSTHATGDLPLRATLTWDVTWHDYLDPEPRPLAEGSVESTVDISVQEIQTIVR